MIMSAFLFDTFNDQRKAYEFDLNPLGITGQTAPGIPEEMKDFSLDVVFQSKGMLTSDGYTIEVAIPFKSIRYNAGKDVLWGAHFWRRIKRSTTSSICGCRYHATFRSWLAQEGHLTGFEASLPNARWSSFPSLTISETGKRKAPVTLSANCEGWQVRERTDKTRPGPDWKIQSHLKKSRSISQSTPDFAQVESDSVGSHCQSTVSIFFAEKRPFFLKALRFFRLKSSPCTRVDY